MTEYNYQDVFNLCFGTYFIYALLIRWFKHIDRLDHDGVSYLSKLSKRFNIMITPINVIISFMLLCIATTLSLLISNYTDSNIATEFIIIFICTYHLYGVLFTIMNKYVEPFKNINPEHKKMYVIKNFVKATVLAGLCVVILLNVSDLLTGKMDVKLIKRCSIYYVINDGIGLLIVEKLPTTTIIHHSVTSICGLLMQFKTSNEIDTLFLIAIYAIFSSFSYCVNYYLGFRIFAGYENIKRFMSIASFWIYLMSCLINWTIQLCLAIELYRDCLYGLWEKIIRLGVHENESRQVNYLMLLQFFLYVVFFTAVAKDDIVLMKWLFNDHRTISNKLK
jgi:hypothetical protein